MEPERDIEAPSQLARGPFNLLGEGGSSTAKAGPVASFGLCEHETIAPFEHQSAPDTRPLLRGPPICSYSSANTTMEPPPPANSNGLHRHGRRHQLGPDVGKKARFAHFRYVVGSLIILAITMNTYANYTIYIAAIEMISNDVIQSGLTDLRAKHLSADPLAVNKNAAALGTCPVESLPHLLKPLDKGSQKQQQQQQQFNATQLSAMERAALLLETTAFLSNVHERLANGKLVDWTINQRGYMFTAHNIGAILLSVPIGRLGLIIGPTWMVFACTLITGVRMLLLPVIAGHTPFWFTFLFEVAFGGPGAGLSILAYPMAAVWLLPDEANFLVAISQLFVLIGTAATNFITTQLLAHQVDWALCYYLPGAILCATALLWIFLAADRPEESRFVSRQELELLRASSVANLNEPKISRLEQELAKQAPSQLEYSSCLCAANERDKCAANRTQRQPNWTTILTCPTVWALVAVNFAFHWNAKIATLWPTFFANILHLEPSTIGIITGVKGIVALVFGSAFAFFTRKLVVRRPFNISLTSYRRLNQVLATLVLGLSIALMVLLDCDFWANLFSVLLTPLVTSFNAISYEQMPLDLSSEDSGLIVSVVRLIAIGDIIALPASSYILSFASDALAGDRPTWRLVWLLGFAIKTLACLLFVLMAKSEPKSYSRLVAAGPCRKSPKVALK